jgi:glycosidase
MFRSSTLSFLLLILSLQSFSQYSISRLEPPFWWAEMKDNTLELMVYGPGIADLEPFTNYEHANIVHTTTLSNPNYLFILLELSKDIRPGSFDLLFRKNGTTVLQYNYKLLERENGSADRAGFNTSDAIYLITPDRFANANPANDNIYGYSEGANRSNKDGRHGGDLKGVSDHLDYISDMGFTAVWLNPVLENNMPKTSYHGYATTDFYLVDQRFGSNEEYRDLGKKMNGMGMKLIMDMVANHIGMEHWWMKDLPCPDWINNEGKYTGTNHRRSTVQDPHASEKDKANFPDGWFSESMPDMNQENPLLARYLIQNSIWWIEYAGLSGIRQDTYSYPDKDFMTRWSCAIMEEYPNFNIVGEEWSENPAIVAYWQKGKANPDGYTSCLGSLMDFPLQSALIPGLTQGDVYYKDGLIRMYEMLANDFIFADPDRLVVFPDNHDMNRFYTQVNEDFSLYKMGIAYILTVRGIPQIYYGTEILMKSPAQRDDGALRGDFPGGWLNDLTNAFTSTNLSPRQLEAMDYMKALLNWRKTKSCLHNGKMVHYAPYNGTYVFFRINNEEKVMVAFNKNYNDVELNSDRFEELKNHPLQGRNVISGKTQSLETILIPARSVLLIEY